MISKFSLLLTQEKNNELRKSLIIMMCNLFKNYPDNFINQIFSLPINFQQEIRKNLHPYIENLDQKLKDKVSEYQESSSHIKSNSFLIEPKKLEKSIDEKYFFIIFVILIT